jgi:4-aminobutyrate aminotransferase-like enzyme
MPCYRCAGKPIGNGFPMGAVVTTREIAAAFDNGMEFFCTGGGGPVAAAAGRAVLAVLRDEALPENAARVGARLSARLRALQAKYP